jgi:hypothetical protein
MIKNISLRYGLIAGISTVAYFLLFYLVNPRNMFLPWLSWSSLLIYIICMWLGCKAFFNENKAEASFRFFLREAFAIYIIANLVYFLFYYLMLEVFDPSLIYVQAEVGLAQLEQYADRLDSKQFEQLKERLESEDLGLKLNDVLMAFGNSAIGGFIIALAVAGVFNKSVEGQ